MDIQIKGDLDGISDQQLDFIRRKIKENNIKGKDATVSVIGQAGDNFGAAVRVISIKNEKEDFKIIVKVTSNVTRLLNETNILAVITFTNEITMYKEVLPMMTQLQKNVGIEPSDMFPVPICYGASNETPHEIILLEDLRKEKYVMLDKFKPLPNDTIKLILRTVAQYHSLCFVLKEKCPEEYTGFCNKLMNMNAVETLLQYTQTFKTIGQQISQMFEDKLTANIIVKTINEQIDKKFRMEKSEKGSKYLIIVHGDCWTNNFLFKLEGDKPTKCIMIDYQLVKEAPPVIDIFYVIFNCTDYETRAKHYYEWIDYYHSQLEINLDVHGLKIKTTYPKDKLESDLCRYAKNMLGTAIISNSLMIRNNEEIAKIKETMSEAENIGHFAESFNNMSGLHVETVLLIKQRIVDTIKSCIDFGYLNPNKYI
ncbi:uncharacterized protein LOC121726368 [Aricia agestis]|uniref:uncharacterized protein LOC121726368 n=1 Tax=Aricia agestis TaxID=91739 RepID=UPI001C2020FE|nr:uncharacterized protein LOC121726368 [Aricia agestis]